MKLLNPHLPSQSDIQKHLSDIFNAGIYSNFGPKYDEYKSYLSNFLNVNNNSIELFSSGTFALYAAIMSYKHLHSLQDKKYCILPSWTFVATAQAIINAGFEPYFIDTDLGKMYPTLTELQSVPKNIIENTAMAIFVSPFGSGVTVDADTQNFFDKHKIFFMLDNAAAISNFNPNHTAAYSLHATKFLGIGEGGFLYSTDDEFIRLARSFSNFGFFNSRSSDGFGVNGKLSEFSCVIGLTQLEQYNQTRMAYINAAKFYINKIPNLIQENWGDSWFSNTCVITLDNPQLKQSLIKIFNANHIPYRDWWGSGCHNEPFFSSFEKVNHLSNTDHLASTTLGIPFATNFEVKDFSLICNLINSL